MLKSFILILSAGIFFSVPAILVTNNQTPEALAEYFVGNAVTIENVSYKGTGSSSGIYTDAIVESQGNPYIESGIVLSSGSVNYLNSNYNTAYNKSYLIGLAPDSDLQDLLPAVPYVQTYDATVLEFNLIAQETGIAEFQYLFGSEEYFYEHDPNYERYTDVMGLFVNGNNIAVTPDGTPVGVRTINEYSNSNLFNNNKYGSNNYATEMDGFTTPLTSFFDVIEGESYHIKLGVTDANDLSYDSYLMLGKGSFNIKTQPVPEPSTISLIIMGLMVLFTGMILKLKFKKGN